MIMKNRKPMNARRLQLYYNIFHLVINLFLFYEASKSGWLRFDSKRFSFRCEPVDFSMEGVPLRVAQISWFYYMSKFTDFFETIIFVMLKRFDLISFYHLCHHSLMPVSLHFFRHFLMAT